LSYLLNYCEEISWKEVPAFYREHFERMTNYPIFSELKKTT